jgi:hypothetical protein
MSKMNWQHILTIVWSFVWWFPIFWPLAFMLWSIRTLSKIVRRLQNLYARTKAEAAKAACAESLPTADVLPPFIMIAWLILQVTFA